GNLDDAYGFLEANPDSVVILTADGDDWALRTKAFMAGMIERGMEHPVIVSHSYTNVTDRDVLTIKAAMDFGYLLLAGYADGIRIDAPGADRPWLNNLALNILQATRHRISKTEYISCPGCGRTLYDLQKTLREIKAATSHLKGLKIGVMGCIVNGPGEMADADYGYVGAAPGRVSLYKGKTCMEKNIPASDAIPRLIALIKENGDWVEKSK
ncbi:MAG: flavodoxin-dependent (E)-4-hydroxy-3-methylbut-2-enyl-diphosphate synthase, partial [Duncaniella sp.]|nr:flavodoxin-dependent (E)-4-hydroxy-3-methylbut-2-enyl-diphosphate synthase [Duncaniella sp.]